MGTFKMADIIKNVGQNKKKKNGTTTESVTYVWKLVMSIQQSRQVDNDNQDLSTTLHSTVTTTGTPNNDGSFKNL
jgi:hypothetical protein